MREPIIILGNQRSGTSLLRQILTNHPNIAIPPESHFFAFLEDKFADLHRIEPAVYIEKLQACHKIEHWHLDFDALLNLLEKAHLQSYPDLIAATYRQWATQTGKQKFLWGDKNSLWFEKLDIYKRHFDPVIIHIIRDPRDIAVSYKDLYNSRFVSPYAPNLSASVTQIALQWVINNERIESLYQEDVYFRVRYEDILTEPEKTLKPLIEFLGVETDMSIVRIEDHSIREPAETMQWKQKLNQDLDTTNVGKFEEKLTPAEIEAIENACGRQMIQYGYVTASQP